MKKNNIGVLITIIILLILFVPCAIYGTYMNFFSKKLEDNPNHEFYYNNKLYFYDKENLVGTYTCKTSKCGYATNYVDENNEYLSNQEKTEIKIINNHYAFISDGEEVVLYDVTNDASIVSYLAVKHNTLESNNYYLVKNNNNLWGMIEVKDNVNLVIPNSYNDMNFAYDLDKDLIRTDLVIANNNEEWQVLTNDNNMVFRILEVIHSLTDKIIVTKVDELYHIYNYSNTEILNNYNITEVDVKENILIATTTNNAFVLYNFDTNKIISTLFKTADNNYEFNIIDNSLVIKENDIVIKTIALE